MSMDEVRALRGGRMRPALLALGALGAFGGGVALYFGLKASSERPTIEQVIEAKAALYARPKAEQLPAWRAHAEGAEPLMRQEGLLQLFFFDDPALVPAAANALSSDDRRVRGVAAQVLAALGPPAALPAREALVKAFREAEAADRPQIAWALVTLGERSLFPELLEVYKAGLLATVERPGGGRAFDVETMARLATPDQWAALVGDPNEGVRALAAGVIGRAAEKKYEPQLLKLVADSNRNVAREAAAGLGRIGDPATAAPLVSALSRASHEDRAGFLEALRDGAGGAGLVLALDAVSATDPELAKAQRRQVFELLQKLADPRAGDALARYLATNPPPHWRHEAAIRLAEVGDLRAAPHLGERLKHAPEELYDAKLDPELRRGDDSERVLAARMLADLAVLHPNALPELRAHAEAGALHWVHEYPQPHANGLRFLVAAGSQKILPDLRAWASPRDPLPKEGQAGAFPTAYETAPSALRYLGWSKDPGSWGLLERQLLRKDPRHDISEGGLVGSGLSMVGMVVRGLSMGAAQGMAQWGDARAIGPLFKLAEDAKQNEGARGEACASLAWVTSEDQRREFVNRARSFSASDPKLRPMRSCLLEAFARRPTDGSLTPLLEMFTREADFAFRHRLARALGWSGLDTKSEEFLLEKVADPELRADAALALVLGGSTEAAARAVALYARAPREAIDELKELYLDSFGYWSDEDLEKGRLYRWVANAEAVAKVRLRDAHQDWARLRLESQLHSLEFDNGPHSVTRVVIRRRLFDAAKGGDAEQKRSAVATLKFLREQGPLMALRDLPGEPGQLARRALFELMNPKAPGSEAVPARASASAPTRAVPAAPRPKGR
ncbi:MAG: HEAT repeat domain-containing protein [Polyangiaceae bacterium]|nr:HEAT repeat domain-containing protein [Polyangiaceae bacterium]